MSANKKAWNIYSILIYGYMSRLNVLLDMTLTDTEGHFQLYYKFDLSRSFKATRYVTFEYLE